MRITKEAILFYENDTLSWFFAPKTKKHLLQTKENTKKLHSVVYLYSRSYITKTAVNSF